MRFLHGSAKPDYIHTSSLTKFEDSTIQALQPQDFNKTTINF